MSIIFARSTAFDKALIVGLNELDILGTEEARIFEHIPAHIQTHWSSYALGAIYYLSKSLPKQSSASYLIEIDSDLPVGAGISSSAALSTGLLSMLYRVFDIEKTKVQIANEAMKIEHYFTGTKCGQMDQLAVLMPKKNHLIAVDFEHFNVDGSFNLQQIEAHSIFRNYTVVGLNTGVQHKLSDSPYNQRREACDALLELIKDGFDLDIPSLGSLVKGELPKRVFQADISDLNQGLVKESIEAMGFAFNDSRAPAFGAHAIWENVRVDNAIEALLEGNVTVLDQALNGSHVSLQHDYEVSCKELDLIRDVAQQKAESLSAAKNLIGKAIIGPRMTGGGFGGSTIQLVHNDILEDFVNYFKSETNAYTVSTGITASVIVTSLANGLEFT